MKILSVDDDPMILQLLSDVLEQHGHTVFTAQDALQALDVLGREPIDLVISDMMMPHLDGLQFTKLLRQDPKYREIPLIILTSVADPDVQDASLRSGAAFYLNKPFRPEELVNLLNFLRT